MKKYKNGIVLALVPTALAVGCFWGSYSARQDIERSLYNECISAVYSGQQLSGDGEKIRKINSCVRTVGTAMSSNTNSKKREMLTAARDKYDDDLFLAALKNYPVHSQKTDKIIPLNEAYRQMLIENGGNANTRMIEDPLGTSCEIAINIVASGLIGKEYDFVGDVLDAIYTPEKPKTPISAKTPGGVINTRGRGRVAIDGNGRMLFNPVFDKKGNLKQYSTYFSEEAQREAEEEVLEELSEPPSISRYFRDVGRAMEVNREDDNKVKRRVIETGKNRMKVLYGTKADADRIRREETRERTKKHRRNAQQKFNRQVKKTQEGFNNWAQNTSRQWNQGTRQAQKNVQREQQKAQKRAEDAWKGIENNFIIPFQKAVGYRK